MLHAIPCITSVHAGSTSYKPYIFYRHHYSQCIALDKRHEKNIFTIA